MSTDDLEEANKLLAAGHYEQAVALLTRVAESSVPGNEDSREQWQMLTQRVRALAARASVFGRLGQSEKAMLDDREAAVGCAKLVCAGASFAIPWLWDIVQTAAALRKSIGRLDAVADLLEEIVQILATADVAGNPEVTDIRVRFLNQQAKLLIQLQRYEDALPRLSSALDLSSGLTTALSTEEVPVQVVLLTNRAGVLRRLGQPSDACDDLRVAIEILKSSPSATSEQARELLVAAHMNRGNANRDLHRIQEALEDYEQALQQLNTVGTKSKGHLHQQAQVLLNRALAFDTAHQADKALGDHSASVDLLRDLVRSGYTACRHDFQGALRNGALLHASLSQHDKTREHYREAADVLGGMVSDGATHLLGDLVLVMRNLGISHECLGDFAEALRTYDQAIQLCQGVDERACRGLALQEAVTKAHRALRLGQFHRPHEALADVQNARPVLSKAAESGEPLSFQALFDCLAYGVLFAATTKDYKLAVSFANEFIDSAVLLAKRADKEALQRWTRNGERLVSSVCELAKEDRQAFLHELGDGADWAWLRRLAIAE